MKFLCDNCNVRSELEKNRILLEDLIIERENDLVCQDIVGLSQYLDTFVNKCVFCNKNRENIFKLDLTNVSGTHSSFYYYGYQHLFYSLYFYITEGIKNNELIYVFMEECAYSKLIDILKDNNVSIEHIKYKGVKELIISNKYGGLKGLKEQINRIGSDPEVENYSGIRWIGQPSYAVQITSQEDFLEFETNLTEALKNTMASVLCIYDAYDYMNEGKYINQTIIEQSLGTHSHIFKNEVLEKIS